MIIYDDDVVCSELKDALESLAYQVLQYEHPTWYSIPEEEVAGVLREEGIKVSIVEDEALN